LFPSLPVAGRWRQGLTALGWRAIWTEIVRWIKYQLVGFSNSMVSLAVLNLFFFLWPPTSQAILVLGSTTAYAAGDINSFWWNGRWTFGTGRFHRNHVARFALLSIAGMAINAAILWGTGGMLLGLFLPAWLVGNLSQLSMAVTGSLGYLVCRFWVFP